MSFRALSLLSALAALLCVSCSYADSLPRLAKDASGSWGCVDALGKVVVDSHALRVDPFVGGLARAVLGPWPVQKVGFIDKAGTWIIGPKFADAGDFSEGLAPALDGPYATGKYGYIRIDGEFVIKPQFDEAKPFSEGVAAVAYYQRDYYARYPDGRESGVFHSFEAVGGRSFTSRKCGYIDKSGKFVIQAQFGDADKFSEGLAAVLVGDMRTGKWGYINKNGDFLIKPQFFRAEPFSHGWAGVDMKRGENDAQYTLIDTTGKVLFPIPNKEK